MVKFTRSKKENLLIRKIVARGKSEVRELDGMSVAMDLSAVNANDCKLDFEKLLEFDDFNFWHDINGISVHIDRETGKLQNCFLPRCTKRGKCRRKI